ncbi:MAG TPA: hypothetical protein VFL49_10410 [Pseudolabrys sp.]|nr:hypothetical protein [Pseudolabrys sp.]
MPKKPTVDKKKSRDQRGKSDRKRLERNLELGLEDTFPASDPVAITEPVIDVVKGDRKK